MEAKSTIDFKEALYRKKLYVWVGDKDNGFYTEIQKSTFLNSLSRNENIGIVNFESTDRSVYVDGFAAFKNNG